MKAPLRGHIRRFDRHMIDASGGWSAPATLDHGCNLRLAAREQRLDGPIQSVAHEACEPSPPRLERGPLSIADALHPSRDHHAAGDLSGRLMCHLALSSRKTADKYGPYAGARNVKAHRLV